MITGQSTKAYFLLLLFLFSAATIAPKIPRVRSADFNCSTLACMRSQACSAGQTMALDTGPGAGTFTCTPHASAWRKPYFDDSGIQIASGTAGNHWKRDFAHTPDDPIQLNWYAWVADKTVIDTLINRFTHDFGDELYVKAPSSTVALDTLYWNSAWNFTGDVGTFMFLESDQAIDIVHGGSAVATMILLEDYDTVKIGGPNLNLRLIGKHPGADCAYPLSPGTKCSEAAGDLTFSSSDTTDALLAFRQNSPAGRLLDIRINALDCNDTCIVHRGMSHGRENRTAEAVLRGAYINGSVRYTGGIRDLDADLTVEDPHARGQGWLGTPYPDNNSCASGELGSDEKSTGFWFQHMESIVGRYQMRYGGVRWFSAGDEHIGVSESERFVIVMDSLGFTGPSSAAPGTQVSTNGCEMQGGKADGWPDYNDGAITRFIEISEEPGSAPIGGFRSFVLEATGVPLTCCADVVLNGLTHESVIGVMDPGEIVSNIIIRGGLLPNSDRLDLRGQNITVIGGTWTHDIRIAPDDNDIGPIRLQELNLLGQIRVGDTTTGSITLDRVTFLDAARPVIPDLQGTFEVPAAGKLSAPVGSTIGGTGTLVCSGNTQSLPYTFDGQEDDCETAVEETLPVEMTSFRAMADDHAILLIWETASEEENVGWGVEMKSTDTFEEIAFVSGGGTTDGPRSYTHRIADVAPGIHAVRLRQVDVDGTVTYGPESEVRVGFSGSYFVSSPYPNPFNPRTGFELSVPTKQHVRVDVYDALGRRVRNLVDDQFAASVTTAVEFDASDLPSGLYLLQITGEHFSVTETAILVK